jgi:hypothetical protein
VRVLAALAMVIAPTLTAQQPPAPSPLDQPLAGAWVTTAVMIPASGGLGARDELAGGRLHLRIPVALGGRLAILGRGDAITLPGEDAGGDLGGVRALEAYLGVEAVFASARGFDLAGAAVAGRTLPFAAEIGAPRADELRIAGGGLIAHHLSSGAWLALLVGQHEAAGPGTRAIVSAHVPIRKGFAVLVDYVSGSQGWLRPGVAYGVSW